MTNRPQLQLYHGAETRPSIDLSAISSDHEKFINLDQMVAMLGATLLRAGIIDGADVIQPIEVSRSTNAIGLTKRPATDYLSPTLRYDIFVPSADQKAAYITNESGLTIHNSVNDPHISMNLYLALTGQRNLEVTEEDVELLSSDQRELEQSLSQSSSYRYRLNEEQLSAAYLLVNENDVEPDIAHTRVYVPGGIKAMSILRRMVDLEQEEVSFSAAKAWIPNLWPGSQTFRKDTPIFVAKTLSQLKSILGGLRAIRDEGVDFIGSKPLVGFEVPDMPGVYVGQNHQDINFNGLMVELFGPSIEEVCSKIELYAQQRLSPDIKNTLAILIRNYAMGRALVLGVSHDHHALLKGQPINSISEIIYDD